jgi:hypothetical protein
MSKPASFPMISSIRRRACLDHLSTNANGDVTVNFSNFKFACG